MLKRKRNEDIQAQKSVSKPKSRVKSTAVLSSDSDDSEQDSDGEEAAENDKIARKTKTVEKALISKASSESIASNANESLFVPAYTNKQRVLIIASRGITARYRHLVEDLKKLIPHHKKDNKLDDKGDINAVNEIAEMKSCNQVIYLETRKHQDLYMYVGKTPMGPSAKFHVVNVHTMDELKLTGNCMLGSRPLLDFDIGFDKAPQFQLMRQLLTDAFSTPLGHPKSKPFVDRIMCFYLIKNNIWVRNYQIVDKNEAGKPKETALVEIGPRFVLIPIRIFSGSLGGPTIYQNPQFVSPNVERADFKKRKGDRYVNRVEQVTMRKEYVAENQLPPDELSSLNVFKKVDDEN